ncbi:MAG: serine/threonine-protein kinase, partial [Nannocystaceae bacterium]
MTASSQPIEPRQSPADRAMEAAVARALFGDASRTAARIGRYTILDAIGAGGMGRVYRAYDPQLDRRVALKLMHPRVEEDATGAARRLRKEAKALARLNHPNVVTVFEVGLEASERFIAMEYVQGQHLAQWVAEHPVPTPWRADARMESALAILHQAAKGLAAAHAVGLIHRDFKPSNVLLGDDGRVRVADFGLARVAPTMGTSAGPSSGADEAATTTTSGGTPRYMAPEQLAGRRVDARTDQYAFCVSAWEVLFGEHPNPEWSEEDRRPAPSGAPTALVRLLERGLALEPDLRFADMTQLLAAWPRRKSSARRAWALASGALVLATVASFGWWEAVEQDDAESCDGATAGMDATWNATEAARIQDAFVATQLPFAAAAAQRVAQTLDGYVDEWKTTRAEDCESGRSVEPDA